MEATYCKKPPREPPPTGKSVETESRAEAAGLGRGWGVTPSRARDLLGVTDMFGHWER